MRGGYQLAHASSEISLLDIVQTIGGTEPLFAVRKSAGVIRARRHGRPVERHVR
ncbi:hypothetical protein CO662_21340 [Rhizobium anhuiense]|uniref:Uncharacterized protein n=1 Tax=Rhizobium anhuiense TaxID=1184720 RepID=A0ABX4J4D8_9HYPH|nr:hypothetical protein CO668_19555 [Rhizobium anhuiense]PDS50031.1 hypothetical protein CO662_21340 [Rhizobium anhuiense]